MKYTQHKSFFLTIFYCMNIYSFIWVNEFDPKQPQPPIANLRCPMLPYNKYSNLSFV